MATVALTSGGKILRRYSAQDKYKIGVLPYQFFKPNAFNNNSKHHKEAVIKYTNGGSWYDWDMNLWMGLLNNYASIIVVIIFIILFIILILVIYFVYKKRKKFTVYRK